VGVGDRRAFADDVPLQIKIKAAVNTEQAFFPNICLERMAIGMEV
jgi:hypothetical protein